MAKDLQGSQVPWMTLRTLVTKWFKVSIITHNAASLHCRAKPVAPCVCHHCTLKE